jgi:hypothetical protein
VTKNACFNLPFMYAQQQKKNCARFFISSAHACTHAFKHTHTHIHTHTFVRTSTHTFADTHAFFFWTTKHKCPSHRNWEMSPIRFVPRLRNNHLTFKFIQKIIFFKNQFEKSTVMQIFVKCQMSYSLKKIQCQKENVQLKKLVCKSWCSCWVTVKINQKKL